MERTIEKTQSGSPVAFLSEAGQVRSLLQLFAQIAAEEGWQPGEALLASLDMACHFAVWVGTELAGGLQVVLPDAGGGLPCQAVWPEVALPARPAHVMILAIRRQWRGRERLFWPLCVELWRFCVAQGVQTLLMEATPSMLGRYRRLGWPIEVIGSLRPHWGEACVLCQVEVRAVAGAMLLRSVRSPAFRSLVVQAMRPLAVQLPPRVSLPEPMDCVPAGLVAS